MMPSQNDPRNQPFPLPLEQEEGRQPAGIAISSGRSTMVLQRIQDVNLAVPFQALRMEQDANE